MSSGSTNNRLRVSNDLQQLAPLFRAAVEKSIKECNEAGLDAIVVNGLLPERYAVNAPMLNMMSGWFGADTPAQDLFGARIRVPLPGELSTTRLPSSASTRSARPRSPLP